jgi:2,5-furandicarboxylate decarboxylase 1
MSVSKDPETGVRSQSIHRMQVKGPDKTGFMIAPGIKRHKEIMLSKAEKMGKPLEVAVVIGMDPAVAIAAAGFSTSFQGLSTAEHMDKYEIAGALRGEPIELVRCKTIDLEVPASAEIVLEGEILPGVREPEGPFSEGGGYYGFREMKYGGMTIFHVRAITHRKNPIYQTLLGSSIEHGYGGILRSVCVQKYNLHFIQRFCPAITAFNVVGLYMAIVAVDKTIEGQQKNAMLTVMGTHPLIKFVVFRAIGRRFHGDKSIITIPDAYTRPLDPATRKVKYSMGMMTKVGLDATMLLDKAIDQPMVEYEEVDLTRYLPLEEIEKHLKLRL